MQPLYILKRAAKRLARETAVSHATALDAVARQQGFRNWGLLMARRAGADPAPVTGETDAAHPDIAHTARSAGMQLWAAMGAGYMALLGARPGQGKTLASLALAAEAARAGARVALFSLEETRDALCARMARASAPNMARTARISIDCSDGLDAAVISQRAAGADVVIVDYLQLLGQARAQPPLQAQVGLLADFARQSGARMALLSQIDRSFEASGRTCPDMNDLRLPDPLDTALFDRACFLHAGHIRMM